MSITGKSVEIESTLWLPYTEDGNGDWLQMGTIDLCGRQKYPKSVS